MFILCIDSVSQVATDAFLKYLGNIMVINIDSRINISAADIKLVSNTLNILLLPLDEELFDSNHIILSLQLYSNTKHSDKAFDFSYNISLNPKYIVTPVIIEFIKLSNQSSLISLNIPYESLRDDVIINIREINDQVFSFTDICSNDSYIDSLRNNIEAEVAFLYEKFISLACETNKAPVHILLEHSDIRSKVPTIGINIINVSGIINDSLEYTNTLICTVFLHLLSLLLNKAV